MTAVRKKRATGTRRNDLLAPTTAMLPQLSAFLSGYLHEDFLLDHATPAAALRAFLADANGAERRALGAEWTRFCDLTKDWAWLDVRRAFVSLGGAWTPPSRAALSALFSAVR